MIVRPPEHMKLLPLREKAPGLTTVQVLDCHIEFTAGEQARLVLKGEVLALENGVPHSVKALQYSTILVTVVVRPQSS
jgi:quercetin dioxygenase-like cupin family protein